MTGYRRYAIYYAPRDGAFADATAAWLGWDACKGRAAAHPALQGLPAAVADLTAAPRKYGFHGTIKAPFRLLPGIGQGDLEGEVKALAQHLPAVRMAGLTLQRLKGFLALLPEGDETELMALAADVVTRLDHLRAPLTEAEIARRRPERLTPRQRNLLDIWGYPHVMEEFRFHLTLSSDLSEGLAEQVAAVLRPWLEPVLPRPFVIEDLCLFGEDDGGRFHLISRHALAG